MKSQGKVKKTVAKCFKNIVDGYATNEEILSFLDNSFELSFFV